MVIWYIFPRFGMLYWDKSGNPGLLQGRAVSHSFRNRNGNTDHVEYVLNIIQVPISLSVHWAESETLFFQKNLKHYTRWARNWQND
jgi:hypothetical protein